MKNLLEALNYLESPVQTKRGGQVLDTPQPFALKTAEDIDNERRKAEIKSSRPSNAFIRNILSGVQAAGGDIASLAARMFGEPGSADIINRDLDLAEQANMELDQGSSAPEWLNRSMRGAVRSVSGMAPAALAGGPWGAMAYGTATRGNQAVTEAQDAGLEGAQKVEYIAKAAAIEGVITGLFQSIGKGGLEAAMAGKEAVWGGIRKAVKDFGKVSLEELPEEITIEILDNINQRVQGINPDGFTRETVQSGKFWSELGQIVRDTTAQTLMAAGMGTGGRQALSRMQPAPTQPAPTQQPVQAAPPPTEQPPVQGPPSPPVTTTPTETTPTENQPPVVTPEDAKRITSPDYFPTDDEIRQWMEDNPSRVVQLLSGGVSRKDFASLGLSGLNKEKRTRFLQKVQQLAEGDTKAGMGLASESQGMEREEDVDWSELDAPSPVQGPPPGFARTIPGANVLSREDLESAWTGMGAQRTAEGKSDQSAPPATETTPAAPVAEGQQPQSEKERYAAELRAMPWNDLRTLAKNNGIKNKGNKESLINALVNNRFPTVRIDATNTETTPPDKTTSGTPPSETSPQVQGPPPGFARNVPGANMLSRSELESAWAGLGAQRSRPAPTAAGTTPTTTEPAVEVTAEAEEEIDAAVPDEDIDWVEKIPKSKGKKAQATVEPEDDGPLVDLPTQKEAAADELDISDEEYAANEIYANAESETPTGKTGLINARLLDPFEYKTVVEKLIRKGFSVGVSAKGESPATVFRASNGDTIRVVGDDKGVTKKVKRSLLGDTPPPMEIPKSKGTKASDDEARIKAGMEEIVKKTKKLTGQLRKARDIADNPNTLRGKRHAAEVKAEELEARLEDLNDEYLRLKDDLDGLKKKGEPGKPHAEKLAEEQDAIRDAPGIVAPWARTKSQGVKVPFAFGDPAVEERLQKAHGAKEESFRERVKRILTIAKNKITRTWEHLPKNDTFAQAKEILRLLRGVAEVVSDDVNRTLATILNPLNDEQALLFERYLMMKNLQEEVRGGGPIRFGFKSQQEIDDYVNELQKFVDINPLVKKAVDDRQKIVKALVDELVEYGLLPNDMNRQWYYHQQVLDFLEAHRIASGNTIREIKRSAQKKRYKGAESLPDHYDYNTSYVEAEFTWMTELRYELEKEKARQKIDKAYNVARDLKKKAKETNYLNLVGGQANLNAINALRAQIKAVVKSGKSVPEALKKQLDKLDPTAPFSRTIGRNIYRLKEELNARRIKFGNNPAARRLMNKSPKTIKEAADMLNDDLFDFLNWVIHTNPNTTAAKAAGNILRAVREKEKVIQKKLGDKYVTWQDLAKKMDTHKIWQPKPGTMFYRAVTIPEKLASKLLQKVVKTITIEAKDLDEVLVKGGPNEQWVIPKELADQLDAMEEKHVPGPIDALFMDLQRMWKMWILSGPKRFPGFTLRNLTGDIEPVIAAAPGALKNIPRAIYELYKYHRGYLSLTPELKLARDLGVINSSLSAQEMQTLKDMKFFKSLASTKRGIVKRGVNAYLELVKNVSGFRENLLRYSTFLYYRDLIDQGKLKHYGGSNKADVERVVKDMGINAGAAKLSRELLGDYQNLTVFGDFMRKRVAPFWAWSEVNITRYPRLFINSYEAGAGRGAAATAAVTTGLILRAHAMYAVWYAINNLFFGDEERELSDDERSSPHLIVGKTAEGRPIIMRNVGALGDFYEWFGVGELLASIPDYANGQVNGWDVLTQVAKSGPNKAIGSIRPDFKAAIELVSGKSFYPDPFNPRTRPRDYIAAGIFGLEDELRGIKGTVMRDGTRMRPNYWERLIGVSDPKRNALYSIYDLREKFLKKEGKETPSFQGMSTFNNMREAAMKGDYEAFKEAMKVYTEKGKTYDNFKSSLNSIDPIATKFDDATEARFMEFLTGEQKQKLDVARRYAQELREILFGWWKEATKEGGKEATVELDAKILKEMGGALSTLAKSKPENRKGAIFSVNKYKLTPEQRAEILSEYGASRGWSRKTIRDQIAYVEAYLGE